jgi:serine/threonine protein kinase
MLGREVGNYRLKRVLGEGGMGAVYLGEHTTLGRRVAVKLLRPELGLRRQVTERFFNEARAANAIRHPNIIEILDLGTLPDLGVPFIIMEFLDGENLARRLERTGRLSLPEAISVAQQTAAAIGAAHAKGIIHRDLKPDNLFLVGDPELSGFPRVKVLDFGIAKLSAQVAPSSFRTSTGAVMGTPAYMSPEQCRGVQKDVGPPADIYALGCILHQMLCGHPPFVSDGPGDVMVMHISEAPRALRARNPVVPQYLEAAVLRALAKKPEERFTSMEELGRALDERTWPPPGVHRSEAHTMIDPPVITLLPDHPREGAPGLRGSETPSGRELPPRRRVHLRWTGVVAGVLALVGGLLLLGRLRRPPTPETQPVVLSTSRASSAEQAARRYLDAAERLAGERRFEPALNMVDLATRLSIVDPDLNIRLAHLRDRVQTGALLRKASGHLDRQEWRPARDAAQQALDRDPSNAEALAILTRVREGERARPARVSVRSRDRRGSTDEPPGTAPPAVTTAPLAAPPGARTASGPTAIASGPPGASASPAAATASRPPAASEPPAPASPATSGSATPAPAAAPAPAISKLPPASPPAPPVTAAAQPASSSAAATGRLNPSALRADPLTSDSRRAMVPVPRLPRERAVDDALATAQLLDRVEAEVLLAGVSADFARGITRALRAELKTGDVVFPSATYYFIVREAALKHDRQTAAANLVGAQRRGQLRSLRTLPTVEQ